MGISCEIAAVVMVVFGVLVIVFPALIAWLVGLFLMVAGVVTLAGRAGSPPTGA